MAANVDNVAEVEPLTIESHDLAVGIAERYGFSFYDGTIVAAVLNAGCDTLHSEDLQDGQVIEKLTTRNPFS